MSKQSMIWVVVVIAALFVLGPGLSDFVTKADAQQVLPGGRAAKIRSYYKYGSSGTIIASAEGPNGFIITDVMFIPVGGAHIDSLRLGVDSDIIAYFANGTDSTGAVESFHFESGLPVPAGSEVTFHTGTSGRSIQLTISGYTF